MNLIIIWLVTVVFLEVNFPDQTRKLLFCDAETFECETVYLEEDKFGNFTQQTKDRLTSLYEPKPYNVDE
jgi:hypothetical protein